VSNNAWRSPEIGLQVIEMLTIDDHAAALFDRY